ncbi:MAG: hypothetical protein AB7U83_10680 [Vicinamibacterales bacterium]
MDRPSAAATAAVRQEVIRNRLGCCGVVLACGLALGGSNCSIRTQQPALVAPTAAPAPSKESPYLKAHLHSGEVYVLDSWHLSTDSSHLEGTGSRFTVRREPAGTGPQSIAVEAIALIETNAPDHVVSIGAGVLGTLTVVMGTITGVCLADPKSCFGSCPTFYVDQESQGRPEAEGFSESIARVLEARDVDALYTARPTGRQFALTMRNEAQETHAVRRVRLLAADRPPDGRVIAGVDERFYPATGLSRPDRCRAAEGDCLAAVAAHDGVERQSPADADDLATREDVELVFPPMSGRVGLVVAARQTLLSTFLFYQTMAYLGRSGGDFLALLERGGTEHAEKAMGMARALGGIDAAVDDGRGSWAPIGSFDEAGPIAGDVRLLPFDTDRQAPIRVRLRMAKGHWRLGWVALARVGEPVTPTVVEATAVLREGRPVPTALAQLRGLGGRLATLPGDAYRISFELPRPGPELELFLETEGYYYEWLRTEWLHEENPWLAALALGSAEQALRVLARPFKEREATLEAAFWASRFRKGGAQ